MHRLLLAVATFVAIASIAALPAAANTVTKLTGVWTANQIAGACKSAGGKFVAHYDGQGYGCDKSNCDGKGGKCSVSCDTAGQCNGSTPDRRAIFSGNTGATGALSNWR